MLQTIDIESLVQEYLDAMEHRAEVERDLAELRGRLVEYAQESMGTDDTSVRLDGASGRAVLVTRRRTVPAITEQEHALLERLLGPARAPHLLNTTTEVRRRLQVEQARAFLDVEVPDRHPRIREGQEYLREILDRASDSWQIREQRPAPEGE